MAARPRRRRAFTRTRSPEVMHDTPPRGCLPPRPPRPAGRPDRRPHARADTRRSVTAPGPLLLVAGPGTGKTRTLTHRVAHLLATGQRRAAGDPRGHVQRARRRRAAAAARRPARRGARARRAPPRPFTRSARGCCASTPPCSGAPTPTRSTTRRDVRRVIEWLLVRPAPRRDPAGARRLRPAAGRRGRDPDRAGQEPAARPRTPTQQRPAIRPPR